MDLMPKMANTMCINRKFEDDSELELAIEQKMFQIQLTNALWHRTQLPAGFVQTT